jgi:1,4-dihydroxy-2-naphthoate polyprenyltransferase
MPEAAGLSRGQVWVGFLLYPGHTLPTAAAPVAVAAGLAVRDGVFAPLPLLVAFAGSWLIHLGGVFADQHELLRRHPGIPEHPELLQALEAGTLSLPQLRKAIWICFALAALTAPYLLALGGTTALVVGLAGVASSFFYAAGPLRYARLGLADPIFFAMFGVVAVAGAYYIQAVAHASAHPLPLAAFVLGLPVGALVVNVLVIDDLRDRAFDAAKGWRTGAVRFGAGWSRREYAALTAFAYLAPLWFWRGLGFGAWILLPWLTLPWAWRIARTVWTAREREALVPMTPLASRLSLAFAVLLAVGAALR